MTYVKELNFSLDIEVMIPIQHINKEIDRSQ